MNDLYEKQDWKDYPEEDTPIDQEALLHMEQGIFNASEDAHSAAGELEEIEEEIEEINKTLTSQGYGTNAGGKNLFNKNGAIVGYYNSTSAFVASADWKTCIIPVTGGETIALSGVLSASTGAYICSHNGNSAISTIMNYKNGTFTVPSGVNYIAVPSRIAEIDGIQVEIGAATSYEPYIDSNLQSTQKVEQLKQSLAYHNFDEKSDGQLQTGGYDASNGQYRAESVWLSTKNKIPCQKGDLIDVNVNIANRLEYIMVRYYDANDNYVGTTWNQGLNWYRTRCEVDNTAYMRINIQKANITLSQVLGFSVHINDDISELNQSLNGLSFKTKTISGTTNANGMLYRGNSNLDGTERVIFAKTVESKDYKVAIGYGQGIWLQVLNYNGTSLGNTQVSVEIIYV